MKKRISKEQINLRFNMLTLLVYVIGIILLLKLFDLQIIKGESYREQSNTRLTRETTIEAARGLILDSTGEELASIKMQFNLKLYKTKLEDEELNNSILDLVNLLQKYEKPYEDTFPIKLNPFEYTIEGDNLLKWKEKYKIDENMSAEDAFFKFKEKYKISNENIEEIRKIISIRYTITTKGYSSTRPITIAENVGSELIAEISEQNSKFPGIEISTETVREYKQGSLAAHILGYIGKISETKYNENKDIYDNDDIIGKTGIEYVFEKYLKGTDGLKQIDMAVDGTITAEYVAEEAVAGSDVVLTIDSNLQKVTEDALEANINKISSGGFSDRYQAEGGSVVVMKVDTGEVLALASFPDFQPQDFVGGISNNNWVKYRDDERHPLLNKAIQSAYAPGSIFKMVTAIAGLETGTITLTEKINDLGKYPKYTNQECWYYTSYKRGHGWLNVSDAIKHSCNFFFYELGDRMGIDSLEKYSKYFGLGNKTGIELPNETSGTLASKTAKAKIKPNEQWYPGETLSAAIGQSYNSFSPIQMAKYVCMLANGGNKVNPTIIKAILNSDGTEVSKEELKNYTNELLGITNEENENLTINPEYLKNVLEGMRSVTSETGGTAYSMFKHFNIEVGGKTGSAEAGKNVNAWFVGFAPFEDPEIVVVVMVENGGHGNYTAEVTKEIMEEYFGMNSIQVNESVNVIPYTEIIN